MASAGAKAGRSFFKSESSRQALYVYEGATADSSQVLAWIPVGIFFTRHVYSVATVTGVSMQPTFNPDLQTKPLHNDVVLLERWSIAIGKFRRGDVVTLWSPQDPNLLTTKRIVALEGDIVKPLPPSPPASIRIPQGYCWVEGDSHYNTRDSNTYGPVPLGLINSKVAHVLWPKARSGPVENNLGKAEGRVRSNKMSRISHDDD